MKPPKFPSLNNVVTPPSIIRAKALLPIDFCGPVAFSQRIDSYIYVDVLTYSISPYFTNIRRAIYCEGNPPRKTESIHVCGNHSKLWICYITKKLFDVYIGSANATAMTLQEIMYKVSATQAHALRSYFDELWTINLPKP